MPANWFELLLAFLGGLSVPILALLRARQDNDADRESRLWKQIGKLEKRIEDMERDMQLLRHERNNLAIENVALKAEVDDLLCELSRPPKYRKAE